MTDDQIERPERPEEDYDAGLMFDPSALPDDYRSGFVAVVGRPNVGKSSLMNAYLGEKIAIVSPKAQTTRNRLLGILTTDQAQLILIDTPGVHKPHHKFGQYMVDVALQAIPDADLILWLVDGTKAPTAEDKLVAEAIAKTRARPPVILAVNKIDLMQQAQILKRLQDFSALLDADLVIPISATRGDNRDLLLEKILGHLPFGPRYFPEEQITDQQERFIAAEMIREAALHTLRQEIPHALAVQVEEFKRRNAQMTYISASLYVERESQKPIVIGQGGKTLKRIGQLARPDIETMVGTQVYLELRVRVQPKWRSKDDALQQFGYTQRDE